MIHTLPFSVPHSLFSVRRLQQWRPAFSLLELMVAFTVLGIALTGLIPLVVMQSRQQARLEKRFDPATVHYLVPAADKWAEKLGACAVLQSDDPGIAPAATVLVIDNSDTSYTETGDNWQDAAVGYQSTSRTHAAGAADATAVWTFSGLQPGWYDVRVTWTAAAGQSTTATYSIDDLTSPPTDRGNYPVDQSSDPTGDSWESQTWQTLGTIPVRSTGLTVTLTDNSTGIVCADAVRLVPVRNTLQVTAFTRTLTDDTVSATITRTVVTPP